jgi:hypothetical protein
LGGALEFPKGNKRIRLRVGVKKTESRRKRIGRCSPLVAAALEVRTGEFLIQFAPVVDPPRRHLEVLHFVPEVWHMFRSESVICARLTRSASTRRGEPPARRTIVDGNNVFNLHDRSSAGLLVEDFHGVRL